MTRNLPFEVGQQAEAKSFLSGFRGAWFRCKIARISMKKGQPMHALEYYDFPDEQIRSTQLYQKSPTDRFSRAEKKELMVRPSFPPVYHEIEMPDIRTVSEVIAIIDGIWKVGDLVDWWKDGCYWSGRITHILEEDKVKIALPEPPIGEGSTYEASSNDLRPSLDWTPEHGWIVPISKVSDTRPCCARLIQPTSQEKRGNDDIGTSEASSKFSSPCVSSRGSAGSLPPPELSPTEREALKKQAGDENKENTETPELSLCSREKETLKQRSGDKKKETIETPEVASHSQERGISKQPSGDMANKKKKGTPNIDVDIDITTGGTEKISFSDSVSSPPEKDDSVATRKTARRDRYNSGASKMMRTSETGLNSMCSDTIESSILDLEELVNRVKWLKGAVEFGFHFSSETKPSWKYLEARAPFPDR